MWRVKGETCVLIMSPTNREELLLCENRSVDVAPTAKKDRVLRYV